MASNPSCTASPVPKADSCPPLPLAPALRRGHVLERCDLAVLLRQRVYGRRRRTVSLNNAWSLRRVRNLTRLIGLDLRRRVAAGSVASKSAALEAGASERWNAGEGSVKIPWKPSKARTRPINEWGQNLQHNGNKTPCFAASEGSHTQRDQPIASADATAQIPRLPLPNLSPGRPDWRTPRPSRPLPVYTFPIHAVLVSLCAWYPRRYSTSTGCCLTPPQGGGPHTQLERNPMALNETRS